MFFFEAIAAVFAGLVGQPLRVLYHNLRYAGLLLLAAGMAVISFPIIAYFACRELGFGILGSILVALVLVAPITLFCAGVYLLCKAVSLLVDTIGESIVLIVKAVIAGVTDGLEGFQREWDAQTDYQRTINGYQQALGQIVDVDFSALEANQVFDALGYEAPDQPNVDGVAADLFAQGAYGSEEDNPQYSEAQFAELENKPISADLLNSDELSQVQRLIEIYNEKPEARRDLQEKQDLELLKRYATLSTNIQSVKAALLTGNFAEVHNEAIPGIDITTPIIIAKEYQPLASGPWLAVPAQSYITDKDTFSRAVRDKGVHTLNRQNVFNPDPQHRETTGIAAGYPVRYRYYQLNNTYCAAPELTENTSKIRALLASKASLLQASSAVVVNSPAPVAESASSARASSTSQSFFSGCTSSSTTESTRSSTLVCGS